MSLEEKISQLRPLLAERDEIDRKLSELIALGPKPLSVRSKITRRDGTVDTVRPAQPKGRKKSICSICKKPGHNAKTCPNGKAERPKKPDDGGDESTPDDDRPDRIRKLLADGLDDKQIAVEVGCAARIVAFYRKQAGRRSNSI
jgi:hypothetical protein